MYGRLGVEAVLATNGLARPLVYDLLGGAGFVEGTDGNEAAVLRDGLRPHAATPSAELL